MLAIRIGAFLAVTWEPRRLYVSSSKRLRCLESGLAKACPCCGYLELGMFDDAAMVLEEIAPEDKNRNEVLGARVGIYMAARKWDMAGAVASHLVKVDPETAGWWISLAYAVRRTESVEVAEAILLRAQTIHPKVAMIAFNFACYASFAGRMEEAKERLRHAIELDKEARKLALEDEDLRPLWDWIGGLK
jgi:Flp pilus assembly protein TadD